MFGDVMKVEDAMTKKPIFVGPEEGVIELAKKMRDKDIGSMLVCEGEKLVGLITSEDLVKRVIIPMKDPKTLKAKDVMTKDLITTTPDEDLAEAIRTMVDNGIKRLPVLDEDGKLVGILTDGDILRMAPELVEVFVEKIEKEEESETLGDMCEICGNYSDYLRMVNGQWVCEECLETSPEV